MKLLYDTVTLTLFPYPREDDEPVVGLDSRFLEMTVIQEPCPEQIPELHRVEPTEVINIESQTVVRGWNIVPEPQPEIVPIIPIPDWSKFKSFVQTNRELNSCLAGALLSEPTSVLSLPGLLDLASQGDERGFRSVWLYLRRQGFVPTELQNALILAATDCNLPDSFVKSLGVSVSTVIDTPEQNG